MRGSDSGMGWLGAEEGWMTVDEVLKRITQTHRETQTV